jgi:hypothetical protein
MSRFTDYYMTTIHKQVKEDLQEKAVADEKKSALL